MKIFMADAVSEAREWLELDPETDSRMTEDLSVALNAFDEAEAMQDWRGCLAACEGIAHDWASNDDSGFKALKRAVEALRKGLGLYEVMPAHLVASHEAAGNWGCYPCNGAMRLLLPCDDVSDAIGTWVREATPADVIDYPIYTK